jgi:excisionase family DNA binding protein
MSRKLLTMDEVAPILNVTVARAYDLARTGVLPLVKLGRQVRVDEARLTEWINAGGSALPGGWRKQP